MAAGSPTPRRVRFEYPDDFDPAWHPVLPEFAAAANAVSMMMPFAEPYVARSVRSAIPRLSPELTVDAEAYVKQELEHHRQHRLFNGLVAARHPSIGRLESVMKRTFAMLERRSSNFGLAFASGFETVAYAGARWTDDRVSSMFSGADPTASTLFLWHLAEEVEHKTVAFDVYREAGGSRWMQLLGMIVSAVVLALFTVVGTWWLLIAQRRVFNPMAHGRLLVWTLSFTFELLPAMAVSMLKGHHPSSLTDPAWFRTWLQGFDPATETMPLWNS